MSRAKKVIEHGSVKFHRVGAVEVWMTGTNRIFIVRTDNNNEVIYPRLQGGTVQFPETGFEPSDALMAFLLDKLKTQKQIRSQWPADWEDEAAFTYTDEY